MQKQLDQEYYLQAKRSLILLRNLKKIDFHLGLPNAFDDQGDASIDGRFRSQWQVVSKLEQTFTINPTERENELQKIKLSSISISSDRSYPELSIDKVEWLVATAFLSDKCLDDESSVQNMAITEGLLASDGSRTAESIPDVGIAVPLLPYGYDLINSFYSTLPLPAPTGLPISCHGHFAISSDRRSIRIDGPSGDWNEFLAQSCLPHLYFILLEYLCARKEEQYYSYWPTSTPVENTIIRKLQSSFWHEVRYTSRLVILSHDGNSFSMSQTIFDGRILSFGYVREDAILKLVQSLRPFNCVLYQSRLNNGLLDQMDGDENRNGEDVTVLNPRFVRGLLRETQAESVVATLSNLEVRDILNFALDKGSLDELLDCYIWRLANGSIIKLGPYKIPSKLAYVVDLEGFDLFEKFGSNVLIRPSAMSSEILDNWTLGNDFNIGRLDGPTIDRFMSAELPHHPMKIFTKTESERLAHVWKYIFRNNFKVTFYETRPSLALQSDHSRFVSLQGLSNLPIMGWDVPPQLADVCSKLKISILKTTKLEPVRKICDTWHSGERFLECLYRLARNYRQIGDTLDALDDVDIRVYHFLTLLMEDRSGPVHGSLGSVVHPTIHAHS